MQTQGVNSHLFPIHYQTFFDQMEAQSFPAVHHSEFYTQAYQPHYRVVAIKFLDPVEESESAEWQSLSFSIPEPINFDHTSNPR